MPIIPYKYTYLFGSLLFLAYWIYLFFTLKKFREQLLIFSIIFAILGPISSLLWFTHDWWLPETILGRKTGIEDLILGFTNGGIAATIYLIFYKNKNIKKGTSLGILKGFAPLIFTIVLTTILFIFLPISSFYSNCIGITIAALYIIFKRKDLAAISILSGFLMLALCIPIYLLMIFISPGWVEATWMVEKLSGILLLGIPIEDFIWYFLIGAGISIMYPYYKNIYYEFNEQSTDYTD